jgi:hypothetical protein
MSLLSANRDWRERIAPGAGQFHTIDDALLGASEIEKIAAGVEGRRR